MPSNYISELREVIRRLHGVEAKHIETVPVREQFKGKMVWDGVVEVFEIIGHPKARRLYAWAHESDNPKHPRRHVTVLHIHPITSAVLAVRAAVAREFRENAEAEG
jgi:hypothetical protein